MDIITTPHELMDQPMSRADQLQRYIDLLLDIDKESPSDEYHDRIERAIGELQREQAATPRMVAYDIPLRPSLLIRINLPIDFTVPEADRLAEILGSIAFPPPNGTPNPDQREVSR